VIGISQISRKLCALSAFTVLEDSSHTDLQERRNLHPRGGQLSRITVLSRAESSPARFHAATGRSLHAVFERNIVTWPRRPRISGARPASPHNKRTETFSISVVINHRRSTVRPRHDSGVIDPQGMNRAMSVTRCGQLACSRYRRALFLPPPFLSLSLSLVISSHRLGHSGHPCGDYCATVTSTIT